MCLILQETSPCKRPMHKNHFPCRKTVAQYKNVTAQNFEGHLGSDYMMTRYTLSTFDWLRRVTKPHIQRTLASFVFRIAFFGYQIVPMSAFTSRTSDRAYWWDQTNPRWVSLTNRGNYYTRSAVSLIIIEHCFGRFELLSFYQLPSALLNPI